MKGDLSSTDSRYMLKYSIIMHCQKKQKKQPTSIPKPSNFMSVQA